MDISLSRKYRECLNSRELAVAARVRCGWKLKFTVVSTTVTFPEIAFGFYYLYRISQK
jgi:hypothetical protein